MQGLAAPLTFVLLATAQGIQSWSQVPAEPSPLRLALKKLEQAPRTHASLAQKKLEQAPAAAVPAWPAAGATAWPAPPKPAPYKESTVKGFVNYPAPEPGYPVKVRAVMCPKSNTNVPLLYKRAAGCTIRDVFGSENIDSKSAKQLAWSQKLFNAISNYGMDVEDYEVDAKGGFKNKATQTMMDTLGKMAVADIPNIPIPDSSAPWRAKAAATGGGASPSMMNTIEALIPTSVPIPLSAQPYKAIAGQDDGGAGSSITKGLSGLIPTEVPIPLSAQPYKAAKGDAGAASGLTDTLAGLIPTSVPVPLSAQPYKALANAA